MASAAHISTPASTLPEWVPERWASKQTPRGSIDALHLLADMAWLDHRAPSAPTLEDDTPPSTPQRRPSFLPSSASSSPSTSPATSCRNSAASTPATSVASTPCRETKQLPEASLSEKLTASLNIAFAVSGRPRKSARFSTPGSGRATASTAPRRSSRIAESAASAASAKKRKRIDEENKVSVKPPRTKKSRTVETPISKEKAESLKKFVFKVAPGQAICKICSKLICDSRFEIERHLLIHLPDSEKPFHCPHCIHSGVQRSNMRTHVENNHPNLFNPFAPLRARSHPR